MDISRDNKPCARVICYIVGVHSIERQRVLTASRLYTQLEPFASKLSRKRMEPCHLHIEELETEDLLS